MLSEAAALLRQGQLVAFPTETVYGLGANALDPEAVARIYAAKGRPSTSPLIVHVASVDMARSLAREWPDVAQRLAERYWPGPLTLVVKKQSSIPGIVSAGLDTVGLRIPDHPLALALLRETGLPLAAPSANRFTELSPTTAEHVRQSLGDRVAWILDGGPTSVGIESTVLSVAGPRPLLLRPGMITQAELEGLIGPIDQLLSTPAGQAHPAPGLHHRHYSPRTPLHLVAPQQPLPAGKGLYLYWHQSRPDAESRALPHTAAATAATLYRTLHQLDQEGWEWIAIEPPPPGAAWDGVRDRLQRAAV